MAEIKVEIRQGAYYDSIVLMELQAALAGLPGVVQVGVMMGTPANKELFKQQGLLTPSVETAGQDDLVISIQGEDEASAQAALDEVDTLLTRRRSAIDQAYLPKSLDTAAQMAPEADWVLVSVPGRYAAGVARDALRLNKNVFLYSDNVPVADEVALKKEAAQKGLLVLGPDCGTAIINGVGLGFANRVRRGPIGLIGASGTGLQAITSRIHQLGSGITQAIGIGGRDLTGNVGGITALQSLDLLQRDPDTHVIVLVSKPPSPDVAAKLFRAARTSSKPVVIYFIGYASPLRSAAGDALHFASSLDEAASMAVALATSEAASQEAAEPLAGYVRGLFSGGTLAYETLHILQAFVPSLYSNIALEQVQPLANPHVSQGHTILDMGEDAFTVGRLHPMLDSTLRLERLRQEAADPEVALILLDVVLGDGAHPDPAAELAPAIVEARTLAQDTGRTLEIVCVVIGTDEDPQDLTAQVAQLEAAGAHVETSNQAAATYVGRRLQAQETAEAFPPVDGALLQQSLQALNVGLESFAASVTAQGATVLHIDWRPPAGGNEKLMALLERMKKK